MSKLFQRITAIQFDLPLAALLGLLIVQNVQAQNSTNTTNPNSAASGDHSLGPIGISIVAVCGVGFIVALIVCYRDRKGVCDCGQAKSDEIRPFAKS